MSETKRKMGATKTLLLGGVVGVALAAACDTPIPTDVQDALVDAMVDENGQAVDAETAAKAEQDLVEAMKHRAEQTLAEATKQLPIIYLDGVRMDGFHDLEMGLSQVKGLASLDPDAIERVEVLKGPAAAALYGSEAEGGVIQIFTKEIPGTDIKVVGPDTPGATKPRN